MMNETLKVTGEVAIQVFDSEGRLKDERHIKNLVVAVGKTFIASRMIGTASAVMSHMAVGTSNTAPTTADTALGGEAGRVAMLSSTSAGPVVTHTATFPAGTATGALVEAGIFNASSAGTMQCRTVFSVVNKGVDDAMSIAWTITVS